MFRVVIPMGVRFSAPIQTSRVPPSLLYTGHQIFPESKAANHGIDHPPPSSTKVKKAVQPQFYSPQPCLHAMLR